MDVRIALDAIRAKHSEEEYPVASTHIIFCLTILATNDCIFYNRI